ncbi:MAG TPA: ferredoxin-thioredoxin reductase catalytic domain-containing protein [Caldisericia bacterium]|nr:ferredoxin-thioredoxin reductase catalytic domain-containing protein [Caldisericia bacterium]HPI83039.1 ferredoxin-thioredoxin reductase catalytic domain-containing protein [Caldisericia bacterium]HPQ92266.1 ferredoxin-thioredoxin reductase catalytic domain-containing protein [Caldisericia bacterium]
MKATRKVTKMNQWTTHEKDFFELLEQVKKIAQSKSVKLNPDDERVEKVVGLMTNNLVETGKMFCPCKQSHPIDTHKDVICPCGDCDAEIEKDGHCFCKLFYK